MKNVNHVTITMNLDKVSKAEFYHITAMPKKYFELKDLPKPITFNIDGKELPGAFIDASMYQLDQLPHDLCWQASGYGNAMFIGIMLSKGLKLDSKVMVWKCTIHKQQSPE